MGEAISGAAALDTLAQLCQDPPKSEANPADATREKLRKRARSKYFSLPMAVGLAELRTPKEKSYRNTIYCASTLVQDREGRVAGTYCGNRWCLTCNRVRTARAINRYAPELASWKELQFVTLSRPNVGRGLDREAAVEELAGAIDEHKRGLKAIGRAIRRTERLSFRALRKIEATYNAERDDYHPHLHTVVEGKAQARALIARWLERYPDARASAQDMRDCDSSQLAELFKYFTKVTTKTRDRQRTPVPLDKLDVIFSAMSGQRVYQPMGFTVPTEPAADEEAAIGEDGTTAAPSRQGEAITWEWDQGAADWVDADTGELLSGYEPSEPFRRFVESIGPPDQRNRDGPQ